MAGWQFDAKTKKVTLLSPQFWSR